jgi:predicted CopG family antitoxin
MLLQTIHITIVNLGLSIFDNQINKGFMKTITLEVNDPVAEKMERLSPHEKKAIADTIGHLITTRRSFDEILEDIRSQAERNGLTPEVLEKILKEIDEEDKR